MPLIVALAIAALGPASTLALAQTGLPAPDPSEVLTVYNSNSTRDGNSNGVYDNLEIIYKLQELRGTLNLLGIPTSISYNTDDHPQSIHIDKLHFDFDTGIYGQDAAVSLPAGEHYFLQDIAAWFEADSANRWGRVKYIELVGPDMPLGTRGNDNYPDVPADDMDSTLYRSLASWCIYLAPGTDQNGSLSTRHLHRQVHNPYLYKVWRTRDWTFPPGTLWARTQINGTNWADSLKLWVLPATVLDGNDVQDVLDLLDRAQHRIISPGGGVRENLWAVIDQCSGASETRAPYRNDPGFADSLADIFSTNILADDDSSSAAGSDTIYLGWPGDITLQAGDTCALFFSSASKHDPRPAASSIWSSQLQFPIAPGAVAWTSESFSSWTIRDTSLRPNAENTQSLICDAIHEGFTYAIGWMQEPLSSKMVNDELFLDGMNTPHVPWACIAAVACGDTFGLTSNILLGEQVSIGPAIGYFRPALTSTAEANPLKGHCGEYFYYSGTVPDNSDTLLVTFVRSNGDTIHPTIANGGRYNITSGQSLNYSIGALWASDPNSQVIVTIKQSDGTLNSVFFTR